MPDDSNNDETVDIEESESSIQDDSIEKETEEKPDCYEMPEELGMTQFQCYRDATCGLTYHYCYRNNYYCYTDAEC